VKRKIAFIINPKSGTDRNKTLQTEIDKCFAVDKFEIQIFYTEFAGHASGLSAKCAEEKFETVVAVGGDGTVNEVARGLLNTGTSLGIVPKGSGNGLARTCGIPLQVPAALEVIKNGYSKLIDAGTANDELFLSNAGTGFDSYVAMQCHQKNSRGLLMYIRTSVAAFTTYKGKTYTITIDGKEINDKAIMVSIANGNEFGYGFKIAPTASNFDGKLDIIIIKPLNFFTAGKVSFHAWWGNLHKYSKVKHLMGREIKISTKEMQHYQLDGDARNADSNELNIKILPKALQVLVP
jgi:YegS/Rv2252/BmrU family lipid kinase